MCVLSFALWEFWSIQLRQTYRRRKNIEHLIMSDRFLNTLCCDANVSCVVWNMLFARVANFYSSYHLFFHCQCNDKFIGHHFDQRGTRSDNPAFWSGFCHSFLFTKMYYHSVILIASHISICFLVVGVMNSEHSSLVRICVNFYSNYPRFECKCHKLDCKHCKLFFYLHCIC